jgi:hypothetical protein
MLELCLILLIDEMKSRLERNITLTLLKTVSQVPLSSVYYYRYERLYMFTSWSRLCFGAKQYLLTHLQRVGSVAINHGAAEH